MADSHQQQQQQQQPSIDLESMSLDQLSQFRQQEEARLQTITNQYAQLRAVVNRLISAKDSLSQLSVSNESKEIMVPLTASLYVPGKVKNPSTVMVDLGTGYYAEKSTSDAITFLARKINLIEGNSANLMSIIQASRQNVEAIGVAMEGKMLEIRAKQEAARIQASMKQGA